MSTSPTLPALGDGWQPCHDAETCPRPHWLAVGYRDHALTAVALHEPTAPRAPAPRERTP
jgi:hypothetical protein